MKLDVEKIDWSFVGICKAMIYYIALFASTLLDYAEVKKEVVFALSLAMIFDTITGIAKSYRLGKKITSREGKKGIIEKTLMLLGLLFLGIIGKLLGIDLSWLVVNSLILLTIFEVYSFFGNISAIRTGVETQEFDAISAVIKFIQTALKTIIDKILNQTKKEDDKE
jgi:hypothetical protein